MDTKRCIKCGKEKPNTREFFHSRKDNKSGLRNECKECKSKHNHEQHVINKKRNNDRSRSWYISNKDRANETSRKWREENGQRQKIMNREWYAANKEHRIRKALEWQVTNKKRHSQYVRRWFACNPEKVVEYNNARRTRKRNADGKHTAEDIQAQYKRQKGRCHWCNMKVGDTYHVDHVIPLSRGGSNDPSNLVIACPSCNRSKGAKLPHEWAQGGRLL